MAIEKQPGIPTPRLVQAGGGDAYFVPNTGPSADRIPGVWYLRDDADGYVSPTGDYVRVRIIELEVYKVT
jgi:hypothetical protein